MRCSIITVCVLSTVLFSGCGGGSGDGEVVVVNDQGPRDEYRTVDIADMDNDGFPDIAAASITGSVDAGFDGHISLFRQNSAAPGSFNAPQHFPYNASASTPREITVDDLQGRGLTDVIGVSLTEGGFRTLQNDPGNPGALLPPIHFGPSADPGSADWPTLASADVTGDLMPDVVIAGETSIVYYPQNGLVPGAFLPQVTIGTGTGNLAVGDLNSDGLNDIVTFMNTNDVPDTLLYYRQNTLAPGQFMPPIAVDFGYSGRAIGMADLDGDGRTDITVSGLGGGGLDPVRGRLTIFVQTSVDTFQRADDHTLPDDSEAPRHAIADLDGDGDHEIIVGVRNTQSPNSVRIYSRVSGATYSRGATLSIPNDQAVATPRMNSVTISDLNNDMQPDIAVSTNEIFVFFQLTGQPGSFGGATRIAGER